MNPILSVNTLKTAAVCFLSSNEAGVEVEASLLKSFWNAIASCLLDLTPAFSAGVLC